MALAPDTATETAAPPPDRAYDDLLRWILLMALIAFGSVILWDYGFLAYVWENDLSGISTLVMVVFLAASLHCLWHLWDLSRERAVCDRLAARIAAGDLSPDPGESRVSRLVSDVIRARRVQLEANPDLLLQGTASELRAPVRFGAFVSETLYKLGLLGTVIGFIMMLVSMRDLGEFDVETMRLALQSMTGGMAVSLLTTIAGLVCGVLLRLQVNILDALALRIVHGLVRISDVLVPSALAEERRRGV